MARNSIILNGKSSNTITGLIIQELPPISKPLMRSQVEEIDGRDGDIITKLGFSAYDKEISVGLYGNFDINEIIAYFNSEGTVTFSNEPDKFYYYQILEQIDFERLVRFRTATINFHVQPFKYSTTEEAETIEAETVSGEGNNLVLENTSDNPFSKLTPKGDTYQFTTTGKNLMPKPLAGATSGGITWTVTSDTVSGSGTASSSASNISSYYDGNFPAGTYTFSITQTCQYDVRALFLASDGTTSKTITIPAGSLYATDTLSQTFVKARVGLAGWTATSSVNVTIPNKFQLELGSQPTSFEPYVGGIPSPNPDYPQDIQVVTGDQTVTITNSDNTDSQTYPLTLGSLELAKIGDYQDYIWKDGSDWKIHKAVGKVVLDGTETWGAFSGDHAFYTQKDDAKAITEVHISGEIISDNYSPQEYYDLYYGNVDYGIALTYNQHRLTFRNKNCSSSNEFKTWLQSNHTTVYYALATPTDTAITDETLIDQLEALAAAHSYKGRTHIISTAGSSANLPHIVEAKAVGSSEATIENSGNYISKPKITIYGSGDIGMYINDVQILQIALGDEGYITIDAAQMEAYKDTLNDLKNRLVTGDYTNLAFKPGDNEIWFSGNVTKYIVENYSRWL